MKMSIKGAVIASAVASMFAANAFAGAPAKAGKGGAEVKCSGTNDCKGKSACSGASNSCSGQNDCKGKGWEKMKTEKDCTKKGGKVVADAKK